MAPTSNHSLTVNVGSSTDSTDASSDSGPHVSGDDIQRWLDIAVTPENAYQSFIAACWRRIAHNPGVWSTFLVKVTALRPVNLFERGKTDLSLVWTAFGGFNINKILRPYCASSSTRTASPYPVPIPG
ncbi:hypothetical protein G6O67_004930 [Ophiocordyceps sinensis]|uniref:Uncharacterized protein n=1 Tax=Ophiocordyceps sinensis TaxID=72228 RepID=A0A8H4PQF9_9HYPO|nr:hypothetical protein G6O67_004930 [Ophiocordyceps sinensis]